MQSKYEMSHISSITSEKHRLYAHSDKKIMRLKSRVIYTLVIFILTVNGISLDLYGAKVTPDKAASLLLTILLLFYISYGRKLKYGGRSGLVLLLWLLLSLVVNLMHVGSADLIQHWLNLSVAAVWFYIIANMTIDWKILQSSVYKVSYLLGVMALAALIARHFSFNPGGLTDYLVPRVVYLYRLVMFSWEPNIFGEIVAIGLLLMLPVYETNIRKGAPVVILLLIALIGALSKGPWLSFAIGTFVYLLLTPKKRSIKLIALIAMMSCGVVLFMMNYHEQVFNSSIIRSYDITNVRLVQLQHAYIDIVASPLFGNGTFSFGRMWPNLNVLYGGHQPDSAWIAQMPIGVLHDTGIVGLVLMIIFWFLLIPKAIKIILRGKRQGFPKEFILFASSIVASSFALLVQDWATTLYSLPIYWAVMGLVAYIPMWAYKINENSQAGFTNKLKLL